MQAAQTQIDAFYAMSAKTLSAKQQMIMDVFEGSTLESLTREEIAGRTNMKLSGVCGRVRELLDLEMLSVRGSVKCVATGNRQQLIGLPTGA